MKLNPVMQTSMFFTHFFRLNRSKIQSFFPVNLADLMKVLRSVQPRCAGGFPEVVSWYQCFPPLVIEGLTSRIPGFAAGPSVTRTSSGTEVEAV